MKKVFIRLFLFKKVITDLQGYGSWCGTSFQIWWQNARVKGTLKKTNYALVKQKYSGVHVLTIEFMKSNCKNFFSRIQYMEGCLKNSKILFQNTKFPPPNLLLHE